jgi:hypothetical protein
MMFSGESSNADCVRVTLENLEVTRLGDWVPYEPTN